jgi:hypothetical protein
MGNHLYWMPKGRGDLCIRIVLGTICIGIRCGVGCLVIYLERSLHQACVAEHLYWG